VSKVKQSEIAVVLGVTEARITQLKAKGMPVNSIDAAAAWYRANIDQKLSPKLTPSIAPPPAAKSMQEVIASAYDLQESRAKREHHEANLAELKERQALGELVEASRVRRAVTTWSAMARAAFEKIPDKLSERLAAESEAAACHALMSAEIDLVLADLASGAQSMRFDDEHGRA
jgi:phage terminase Nu1 subunit (DNA packaging protein)